MTSKNLFTNMQKEDMKRRIWLIALSVIGAFLLRPVRLLMALQSMKEYARLSYVEDATAFIHRFFAPENGSCAFGIIVLATFLGISGYAYLFNKKKTDFYHSVPLKREKLFFAYYLNGIYIYLILYITMQMISLIITGSQGFLTMSVLSQLPKAFIVHGVYFLFVYHMAIVGTMLTGNLPVAVAGITVLFFYAPAVIQTFYGYYNMYFQTYYQTNYLLFQGTKFAIFSPVYSYIYYIDLLGRGANVAGEASIYLAKCGLIAAALLGIAIWLYRIRPSEVAERAMAFPKTENVIRIMMVIPVAMLGAVIFGSIANTNDGGWFWFGLVFSGVLCHATMEAIYRFDFKAVLNHRLQMVLCVAAAVIIALCFQKDIFGYDRYLPAADKIESTAVSFSGLNQSRYDYDLSYVDGRLEEQASTSADSQVRLLNNMKLTDVSDTIALAQLGIQDTALRKAIKDGEEIYGKDDVVLSYTIRYNLKNGKAVYRTYTAAVKDALSHVRPIYESPEYKTNENLFTVIVNTNVNDIGKITIYDNMDSRVLSVNKDTAVKLAQTYIEELSAQTIDDLCREDAILRIEPTIITDSVQYQPDLQGYYIYPSFTKTLALLQEQGLSEDSIVEKIDASQIIKISASGSLAEEYTSDNYKENYHEIVYENDKDAQKIQELSKVLIPGNFLWDNYPLRPYEQNIYFDVTYHKKNGGEGTISMSVPKGAFPDFIYKDFKTTE